MSDGWGYDSIYSGYGADIIDVEGLDTVVFSGEYLNGVHVDLMIGTEFEVDAEGDTNESIENIQGSEFNDTLHGNDDDNIIRRYEGSDYIVPMGGDDILPGGFTVLQGCYTAMYYFSISRIYTAITLLYICSIQSCIFGVVEQFTHPCIN